MNKKTFAMTIVSVFIVSVVVLVAGIRTSLQPKQENFLKFTDRVTVTASGIEYDSNPTHFKPIGKNVTFDVEIGEPEGMNTEVIIHIGSPDSDSIVKETITGSGNAKLHVTDAEGKDLYVQLIPEKTEPLAPASYSLQVKLNSTTDALKFNSRPLILSGFILFFAIYLIVEVNRNEKKFDERQLAARGKAAMNALIIVLLSSITCGLLSMSNESFPISMYEAGIGSAIIGVTAFIIMCDINDAFFGLSEKRSKFLFLSWVMGFLSLLGAGMTFLGLGSINEITCTGIVVGICFFLVAIELTVKSAYEKKEAAYEES